MSVEAKQVFVNTHVNSTWNTLVGVFPIVFGSIISLLGVKCTCAFHNIISQRTQLNSPNKLGQNIVFFPKFAFLPDLQFWKSPVNFWKTLLNLAGKSRKFLDTLLDLAGGTSVKSSCPRLLDTNFDKNSFYHINLIQESSFVQQAGLQLQHLKYIKLFKNLMEIRF